MDLTGLTGLAVGVLAVWRVTHLLHAEDGPWGVCARLRRAAGQGVLGRMLGCFHCLSLWVAIPAAAVLARSAASGVLLWLGLSGGAIVVAELLPATVEYHEDPPAAGGGTKEGAWDAAEEAAEGR